MTSQSRKKPRTTPARGTRPRTGISLLALLAVAGSAAGQGALPPPAVPTPGIPPVRVAEPPAPLPVIAPADSRVPGTMPFLANPTPPAALPATVPFVPPAPTIMMSKPAGADAPGPVTAQPVTAQPVARYPSPPAAGMPQRYDPPPAVAVPVAVQPPDSAKRPADEPNRDASNGQDRKDVPDKEQDKVSSLLNVDPKAPPIARTRAFTFDSDKELNRRIVAEIVEFDKKNTRDYVYKASEYELPEPKQGELMPATYVAKTGSYSPTVSLVEPGYVVHRRLLFEEKNSERNGWDLGIVQPVVSAGVFVKDAVLLPMHMASNLHERYDTSAGKCLPGNAVPYYLYPEQITLFGATVGVLYYTAGGFIFPQ